MSDIKKHLELLNESKFLGKPYKSGMGEGSAASIEEVLFRIDQIFRKGRYDCYSDLEAIKQGARHHLKDGADPKEVVQKLASIIDRRMRKFGNYSELSRFKEAIRQSMSHHLKLSEIEEYCDSCDRTKDKCVCVTDTLTEELAAQFEDYVARKDSKKDKDIHPKDKKKPKSDDKNDKDQIEEGGTPRPRSSVSSPFEGGKKARTVTRSHRPLVWENMFGTVYAYDGKEVKYFNYNWDGARAYANVTGHTDLRIAKNPASWVDKKGNYGPSKNKWVLFGIPAVGVNESYEGPYILPNDRVVYFDIKENMFYDKVNKLFLNEQHIREAGDVALADKYFKGSAPSYSSFPDFVKKSVPKESGEEVIAQAVRKIKLQLQNPGLPRDELKKTMDKLTRLSQTLKDIRGRGASPRSDVDDTPMEDTNQQLSPDEVVKQVQQLAQQSPNQQSGQQAQQPQQPQQPGQQQGQPMKPLDQMKSLVQSIAQNPAGAREIANKMKNIK